MRIGGWEFLAAPAGPNRLAARGPNTSTPQPEIGHGLEQVFEQDPRLAPAFTRKPPQPHPGGAEENREEHERAVELTHRGDNPRQRRRTKPSIVMYPATKMGRTPPATMNRSTADIRCARASLSRSWNIQFAGSSAGRERMCRKPARAGSSRRGIVSCG